MDKHRPFMSLVGTLQRSAVATPPADNVVTLPQPKKASRPPAPLDQTILAMASMSATLGQRLLDVKHAPRSEQVAEIKRARSRMMMLLSCTNAALAVAALRDACDEAGPDV